MVEIFFGHVLTVDGELISDRQRIAQGVGTGKDVIGNVGALPQTVLSDAFGQLTVLVKASYNVTGSRVDEHTVKSRSFGNAEAGRKVVCHFKAHGVKGLL